MKSYLKVHPWAIIEDKFHPEFNLVSESIFSLGNGSFGGRGSFEEEYFGQTHEGNYIGGVYYPDKTRVGWWKNGYPDYFAKVLNAPNWTKIHFKVNDKNFNLSEAKIIGFQRKLDMKNGILSRRMQVEFQGINFILQSERICSYANPDLGLIKFNIKVISGEGNFAFRSLVDGYVQNADANYDEMFWENPIAEKFDEELLLSCTTKKTAYQSTTASHTLIYKNRKEIKTDFSINPWSIDQHANENLGQGDELKIEKYVAYISSFKYKKEDLKMIAAQSVKKAIKAGMEKLFEEHQKVWASKWEMADIKIEGDDEAQQSIRYNIFQLHQTYNGKDHRLNIGPKGFTGEKYGGATYWDTEAFCLPFYLSTAEQKVAKNLLKYRHNHLQKAIENAQKLGFKDGAALFPMVTMNGEECHNEWEITFEEIHRNGAIAYAMYEYEKYTGDENYVKDYGIDVLIGIAKFWAQRFSWSEKKEAYVLLGVTGPNEFENNVNNNWYTNYIAVWCIRYTIQKIKSLQVPMEPKELMLWQNMVDKVYFPFDKERQIFLQQDGFLDKELIPVEKLDPKERPIVENWSWDKILRSVYIKQADVLQGIYCFQHEFDLDTIKRNFEFYEQFTVHESSLSPCIHSILAAKIGDRQKAYEYYLRTARLDLNDINNDTKDGLHITSMAGSWLSIVKGFSGMDISNGELTFQPFLPDKWKSYSFRIFFRGKTYEIVVNQNGFEKVQIA